VDAEVEKAEAAARIIAEKQGRFRAELAELPLGQLKKRARAEGFDEHAVDDVDDAAEPKAAIIDMFMAEAEEKWLLEAKLAAAKAEAARVAAEEEVARIRAAEVEAARVGAAEEAAARARAEKEAAFRAELAELTLKALKKRARAEDFDEDAVDTVDDADDPKAAIIDIYVAEAEEKWTIEEKMAAAEAEAARVAAEAEASRIRAADEEAARAKAAEQAATRARAEEEATLRAELAELKLRELKKRARAEGLNSHGRYWHIDATHYVSLE
jgi:hypothetical protein